tara:strand:- start:380 stop:625 length:246 start_codon:yes stop_codon:yes gene_type:complete
MRRVLLVKSHEHGVVGIATNKKAAYKMIQRFEENYRDPKPLSHSYGQMCSEMKERGFVFIGVSSGIVEVMPYDTNECQPEC